MEQLNKDEGIRLIAIDCAIKAGKATVYNDLGFAQTNADLLIETAKKIEAYLKGDNNVE